MAASNANTKLVFTYISPAEIILLSAEVTSWKACTESYISKACVGMEVLILFSTRIALSLMVLVFNIRRLFQLFPHIISCSTFNFFF